MHTQARPGGLTRPRMGAHGGRGLGSALGSLPGHRASTLKWICKSESGGSFWAGEQRTVRETHQQPPGLPQGHDQPGTGPRTRTRVQSRDAPLGGHFTALFPQSGFIPRITSLRKRALKGKRRKRPGEGGVAEWAVWPSGSPALAERATGSWGDAPRHKPLLTSTGTAPPARPRVSCRLRWGGCPVPPLGLRTPHPQTSLPHWDPDTPRPAVVGPCTLSSAHPFFTRCLLSTAALWGCLQQVGGSPPRGSGGGWAAGAPGSLHCPWGQGVGASQSLVLPQQERPLSTGGPPAAGGEGGDQRPPEHPHSGLHNTHLHLKGDLSPPSHLVNSPISP